MAAKRRGRALKDEQGLIVYSELVEWRFTYISQMVTLQMCGGDKKESADWGNEFAL